MSAAVAPLSPRVTGAIVARVLAQLRHDRRTLAILLVVPAALISLLWWSFEALPGQFDRVGPSLLAIFPFVVMFLVTSVTTLRERTGGTLERLFTLPMSKGDFLLGYALAFGLLAVVQALVAVAVGVGLLGLEVSGPLWMLGVVAIADGVLGAGLGLFVSAFAATEFQAVQFLPVVVIPQLLLCGLLVPRSRLPELLGWVSDVLPLSYALDAMTHVAHGDPVGDALVDVGIVAAFTAAALLLGALTLRRRTA